MTARTTSTAQRDCAACAWDWEHCHGVWVEHSAGGECTQGDCDVPAEAHEEILPCARVSSGCCESPDD